MEVPKLPKSHLLEVIAGYIHYMWCNWITDLLGNLTPQRIEYYKKMAAVRYKDLSEEDKDKRRTWAREILKLVGYR